MLDPSADPIKLNNMVMQSNMQSAIASAPATVTQPINITDSNSENSESRKTSTASEYTPDSTVVMCTPPELKATIEQINSEILAEVAQKESHTIKSDEQDGCCSESELLKVPQRKISRFLISPVLDKLDIPESMQQNMDTELSEIKDIEQPPMGPELINTLEQLQIGLENITHVMVKKIKDDKESNAQTPTEEENKCLDATSIGSSFSSAASFASLQPNLPQIPEGVQLESSAPIELSDLIIKELHEDIDESMSSEQFSSGTGSLPPLRVDLSRRASCELVLDSTALSTWNSSLSNTPDSTILPNSSDQAALLGKKLNSGQSDPKLETLQTLHRKLSQLTSHSDVSLYDYEFESKFYIIFFLILDGWWCNPKSTEFYDIYTKFINR